MNKMHETCSCQRRTPEMKRTKLEKLFEEFIYQRPRTEQTEKLFFNNTLYTNISSDQRISSILINWIRSKVFPSKLLPSNQHQSEQIVKWFGVYGMRDERNGDGMRWIDFVLINDKEGKAAERTLVLLRSCLSIRQFSSPDARRETRLQV